MPIDREKWLISVDNIESSLKSRKITQAQADEVMAECRRLYNTPDEGKPEEE